jgi:hypothetical protein
MDIIYKEKVTSGLLNTASNTNKVLALIAKDEALTDGAKAAIDFFVENQKLLIKMVETSVENIEKLGAAYERLKHMYDVEKQKNTGSFKSN